MFPARHMLPVIIAVLQPQQLSFRFMLDTASSHGNRDAAIALFSMQMEHQSQIGNFYINYQITRVLDSAQVCQHLSASVNLISSVSVPANCHIAVDVHVVMTA